MNREYRNFLLTHACIILFAIVVVVLGLFFSGCELQTAPDEPRIEVPADTVLYPGLGS